MNYLASEGATTVLALLIVVEGIAAVAVSLAYSIPYAVRKLGLYPDFGARRLFARNTLTLIVTLTLCVVLFLSVGAAVVLFEDTEGRKAAVRLMLFGGISGLCALVIWIPLGHAHIEAVADREMQERQDDADTLEAGHQDRHDREGT